MAALTDNRTTESRHPGRKIRFKMANSTTIYAGGLVMLDSAGLATAAAASVTNQGCVGVAVEKIASGTTGTDWVIVQEGIFKFGGTVADTTIGKLIYGEDDQTVSDTQGSNEPVAGVAVERVDSATVWVNVNVDNARGS